MDSYVTRKKQNSLPLVNLHSVSISAFLYISGLHTSMANLLKKDKVN